MIYNTCKVHQTKLALRASSLCCTQLYPFRTCFALVPAWPALGARLVYCGVLWHHMASYGIVWLPMAFYGFLWLPLASRTFAHSPPFPSPPETSEPLIRSRAVHTSEPSVPRAGRPRVIRLLGSPPPEETAAAVRSQNLPHILCPNSQAHPADRLQKLHQPGIEPGSHRWQRCILPLDH